MALPSGQIAGRSSDSVSLWRIFKVREVLVWRSMSRRSPPMALLLFRALTTLATANFAFAAPATSAGYAGRMSWVSGVGRGARRSSQATWPRELPRTRPVALDWAVTGCGETGVGKLSANSRAVARKRARASGLTSAQDGIRRHRDPAYRRCAAPFECRINQGSDVGEAGKAAR